jgi:rod shape-determining protein MreD
VSPGTGGLVLRLVVLGAVLSVLQIAAVSQLTIFGANADLLPLAVAAVGLLCGSMTGAIFGFAVGLFVDTALVQTMGLSSLVYVVAGYGAGRLRELRDPQAALVPMAVGAGATAVATVGYSVLQFLLGVDAPISLLLLRQVLVTIIVNTLVAYPVYALTRRVLLPALPDDPRRRRRRASATGGLSPLSRS